jgi:2-polyprenyl-6-hydroxyphenyl methylase/3-demethylubiquinone-9 3-methyltransferase
VLEHVNDLDKVIAETARALRPGGIYLYDTINRTFRSKLIMIKLFQEWDWTSFMPPRMHDWQMFIKPAELCGLMGRYGLESRGLVGLKPSAHPIQVIRTLRKRKRGEITYTEAGRQMNLSVSKDTSVMYMGYGIKNGLRPAVN